MIWRRCKRSALALIPAAWLAACGGRPAGLLLPAGPTLASYFPAFAVAGSGGLQIVLGGTGFGSGTVARWNGAARPTQVGNANQLTMTVSAADLAAPGTAMLTVADGAGAISNALAFGIASPAAAGAGVILLVSAAMDGGGANGDSLFPPALSASARYIAFQSNATNLVPGAASGFYDIYVRDTCIGAPTGCVPSTVRASVATDGTLANGNSRAPSISGGGRFVAFDSSATNLVPNDTWTNGNADIFLRDTCIGAPTGCAPSTTRLSVTPTGAQANGESENPRVSADGRYIAFDSGASDLVAGDVNGWPDVFVRDTCWGAAGACSPATSLTSLATSGTQGDADSFEQIITPDGRFVAFESYADNLVPGDTNGNPDIFVRDTCTGAPAGCTPTTFLASLTSAGGLSQGQLTYNVVPSLSANGRFVAFASMAGDLVPGDTNQRADVFLRDTCVNAPAGCAPTTTRVSIGNDGAQGNDGSSDQSISADGRLVALASLATNLVPADTEPPMASKDIFVRDTCFGAPAGCSPSTVRVSVAASGKESNGVSDDPVLSADGHYVAFVSNATNLAPGANGHGLIFLAKTGF
ncbi:MAG: hypothetical protein ACRD2H_12145 [Terriglobales bacterium]